MNETRREMLASLSHMLIPARKILGISRSELAKLSGLPENVIASAENGTSPFKEEHYIAVAAVLDNELCKEDRTLYSAVIRLMATEEASRDYGGYDEDDDFVLVRRWLDASCDDDDESDSSGGRVLTDKELEILAGECRIFADSTAISDENFPALMSRLAPFLKESGRKVIIPYSAVNELSESPDDDDESAEGLSRIERFRREGLIEIRGSDNDGATSETLADVFRMYEGGYNFMLITQDSGLAGEFSGNDSVRSARINDKGDLVIWDFSGKNIDEWQLS